MARLVAASRRRRPAAETAMHPLGSLVPRTKIALLRSLLRGEASARELARRSALHLTVVRKHMSELARAGLVATTQVHARRGRPALRYGITPEGRGVFAARYDVVLETVARTLADRRQGPLAEELFREAGRTLADRLGAPKDRPGIAATFRAIGFEPEFRTRSGSSVLLSRNCPILKVAVEHPELICDAFHGAMLGRVFGTRAPPLRQAIARGAPYCVHELTPPRRAPSTRGAIRSPRLSVAKAP